MAGNWILDYVQAIDKVSEAPLQYNIWSAISVISSILKRNIYINYKTFTIYPNMYIVLVGPPGVGKGTAIHPAHSFAKEKSLANYMSDRVTAPRIIEKLFQGFTPPLNIQAGQVIVGGKDSSATLMSSELPTLISSSDWMLQFLCDAWDRGEFDYDTRNKGSFTVADMCVSLIGACVPDYIRKINKDVTASVSSGFSARTIFVNAKVKSKSLPWGEGLRNNPALNGTVGHLEAGIQAISYLKGEVTLAPEARKHWDLWYDTIKIDENDSDVFSNFRSRQHIHVLKTAMILNAAEGGTLIITKLQLEKAIALVDNIAAGVDEIFRGIGESDIAAGIARLQLYFERKGTATHVETIRDNVRFLNPEDITKVLNVLELIGFITNTTAGYTHTGQLISPLRKTHKVVI